MSSLSDEIAGSQNVSREELETARIKLFRDKIGTPVSSLALFAWASGMWIGSDCLRFFPVGLIWSLALWWMAGWFKDFLVNNFRLARREVFLHRMSRYTFAFSLAAIFCLVSIKALLVVEPYCPSLHDYSYKLKQDRGALSWEVTLRTSLPIMMAELDRKYYYGDVLVPLRGFSTPLNERLKSHLRSVYEATKDNIEVTVSISPSLDSLLNPTLDPLPKKERDQLKLPPGPSHGVTLKNVIEHFLGLKTLRSDALRDYFSFDFLRGSGALKEEQTKPEPPYWVVPNDFEDHITLSLDDVETFRARKVEKPFFGSRTLERPYGSFWQEFVFSVPSGQAKLEKVLPTRKLSLNIGITNTEERLTFDFPFPFRFSELVAANRFGIEYTFAKDLQGLGPFEHHLHEEEVVPGVIRETFPNLIFSTFPVSKRVTASVLSTSVQKTSMAIWLNIIDALIILSGVGVVFQLLLGSVRRVIPGASPEVRYPGETTEPVLEKTPAKPGPEVDSQRGDDAMNRKQKIVVMICGLLDAFLALNLFVRGRWGRITIDPFALNGIIAVTIIGTLLFLLFKTKK